MTTRLFRATAVMVIALAALRAQTPVEPIAAIAEAFRSHAIVAVGNVEFRGDEQCQAFLRALVRDPRITAVVNDIVVEFGSARYQDVIDRFVRGEEVPPEALRRVWQDTTQVEYEWDRPIYEEFFRTVRTVNASLPRSRQLRVLLGDPPIDWDQVHTIDDLHKGMGDRDAHAIEVIRREVLSKNRRALVIYGSQHLVRRNTVAGGADEWSNGIVARLEKQKVATAFSVLPETRRDLRSFLPAVASWQTPSLTNPPRHSARRYHLGSQSTASSRAVGGAVRRTPISRAPRVHDDVAACEVPVRGSQLHGDEGQTSGLGSTSVRRFLLVGAVEGILRQSGWAEGDSGLRSRDHQSDPQDASRRRTGHRQRR
jgi:hypothetical protein